METGISQMAGVRCAGRPQWRKLRSAASAFTASFEVVTERRMPNAITSRMTP